MHNTQGKSKEGKQKSEKESAGILTRNTALEELEPASRHDVSGSSPSSSLEATSSIGLPTEESSGVIEGDWQSQHGDTAALVSDKHHIGQDGSTASCSDFSASASQQSAGHGLEVNGRGSPELGTACQRSQTHRGSRSLADHKKGTRKKPLDGSDLHQDRHPDDKPPEKEVTGSTISSLTQVGRSEMNQIAGEGLVSPNESTLVQSSIDSFRQHSQHPVAAVTTPPHADHPMEAVESSRGMPSVSEPLHDAVLPTEPAAPTNQPSAARGQDLSAQHAATVVGGGSAHAQPQVPHGAGPSQAPVITLQQQMDQLWRVSA